MSILLRKKPPGTSFSWMVDWGNVSDTPQDAEAYRLYSSGSNEHCNLERIRDLGSPTKLLTFLRYDYKKVLLRARYLYIDRLRFNDTQINGTDLDLAFFEPVLLCFPNLEFLGRLQFPELYGKSKETKNILTKMLTQMRGGYERYADKLIDWHRNALSHELRPDGTWQVNLNTGEARYCGPEWESDRLCLNVPHFIDSCLLQLEHLCDQLTGSNTKKVMIKFSQYVSKRFPNGKGKPCKN